MSLLHNSILIITIDRDVINTNDPVHKRPHNINSTLCNSSQHRTTPIMHVLL